jgi:hypothetical protein
MNKYTSMKTSIDPKKDEKIGEMFD